MSRLVAVSVGGAVRVFDPEDMREVGWLEVGEQTVENLVHIGAALCDLYSHVSDRVIAPARTTSERIVIGEPPPPEPLPAAKPKPGETPRAVLAAVINSGRHGIRTRDMEARLGVPRNTIRNALSRLQGQGRVVLVGHSANATWYAKGSEPEGARRGLKHRPPTERERVARRMLNYLEALREPEHGIDAVAWRLGAGITDPNRARHAVNLLRDQGLVRSEGKTRNTRWFLVTPEPEPEAGEEEEDVGNVA